MQKLTIVKIVLQDNALHHFETSANNQTNNENIKFEQCIQEVSEFVFPEQAVQQQ